MKKTLTLLAVITTFICLFAFHSSASIVSEAKPINLDETVVHSFNEDNNKVIYKFTPNKTDYYEIRVGGKASEWASIYFYDQNGNEMKDFYSDDFSGECKGAQNLKANKTYYFVIYCDSEKNLTSEISLYKHKHSFKYEELDKAILGESGSYYRTCKWCGIEEYNEIPYFEIVFNKTSYAYTGKTITPAYKVVDMDGKNLKKDADYTVSGTMSAIKIGTYSFTVKMKGLFSGTHKLTYKIVPAKVTSLKASSQTASTITLNWNKVNGAGGYAVYLYDSDYEEYEKIATVTTNTAKINKLPSGKTQKFIVKAYKKVDKTNYYGSASSALSATTLPAAPKLKATQKSDSITLSWGKVSGANGYVLYSYNAKTKKYTKLTTLSTTKTTIKKLNPATAYSYSVRAYRKFSSKNYYSSYSEILNTATRPVTPTGLKATQTTTSITLTWNKVKGATGYTIYDDWGYKVATSKTNKVIIEPSVPYAGYKCGFKVIATSKINNKNYNSYESKMLYTATKPEKPLNLEAEPIKKGAELHWWNDYCSDFQIYMSTTKNGEYKKVKTFNAGYTGSLRTTINKLNSGKTYYFKVRGYVKNHDTVVYSSWSDVVKVKVK